MTPQAQKRLQARHVAACARYQAGHQQPPTRKQAQAWLAPIRRALNQMRQGEIDSHRGYAITRLHHADNDFARVDHCINGFVALIDRLMPALDTGPLKRVSKKLETGVLLAAAELDDCFALLNTVENRLLTYTRSQLKDAALTEQINIEFELLGIKSASC